MIPWTSSSAAAEQLRSAASAPLPLSAFTNVWISAPSAVTARNWSRSILRKNRSRPWIAVVPSYNVSILASRTYCSSG